MNKKIKVSRHRNTVQCSVPSSILSALGVLPGDEIEFSNIGNKIEVSVSARVPLDKIDFFKKKEKTVKVRRVR